MFQKMSNRYRIFLIPMLGSIKNNKINVLFVTVSFLAVVSFLYYPRDRLYHLDADTESVELQFIESTQNRWLLDEFFTLCELNETITWADEAIAASKQNSECKTVDLKQSSEPILELNAGTIAYIEWSLYQGLNIELKSADESGHSAQLSSASSGKSIPLSRHVIIHRPASEKPIHPALTMPFEAVSVFGTDVRTGVRGILNSGNLSVYEDTLFWHERYLAGSNPLYPGDTIKFTTEINGKDTDLPVKGFLRISNNEEGNETGIHVAAYTGSADIDYRKTKAKIFRFGTDGYNYSPSMWTRIENAPDIIIFISFFAIFWALMEVGSKLNAACRIESNDGQPNNPSEDVIKKNES